MRLTLRTGAIVAIMWLSACSPSFAPANAPTAACKSISKAQFEGAKAKGAAIGRGKIKASGISTLNIGAGVVRCSNVPQSQKTCIRPNDFAIEYTLSNERLIYVLIPKQTQYRFTVSAKPTPCRVIVSAK